MPWKCLLEWRCSYTSCLGGQGSASHHWYQVGRQTGSGHCAEVKNLLLMPGNKLWSLGYTACSLVTIVTELSQLPTEQLHFIDLFQIADCFCRGGCDRGRNILHGGSIKTRSYWFGRVPETSPKFVTQTVHVACPDAQVPPESRPCRMRAHWDSEW